MGINYRDKSDLNEQLMQADAGFWSVSCGLRLQAGVFSFVGREYQVEPMSSRVRRICYIKGTQILGGTEMEVIKSLHGMIMGRYTKGVAYIFPTNDEVGEFSKSRFNPLISKNRSFIGKYVKSHKGSTDTTSLKTVREAFLFLRGARQSQKIGDSMESTTSKTAGIPVDRVVFDEVDYMDTDVIEKYKGRMGESLIKEEVYLGNPSHEDFGIDLIFKQSDQRYWFRKCGCGHWTCAEKSFPQCVKIRQDGTGYVGCDKCGKEVPAWSGAGTGEWVADFPTKSNYMHGYMASQLISPRNDPAEILEAYVNPPFGNLADVYRLKLGRPYSSKDEKLSKGDVLACCGNDAPPISHPGPCAMGVDVGKTKHVVIGFKVDNKRFEIIRAVKIPEGSDGWNQIHDLARMYNVKSTVIDIGPYYEQARSYQKACGHKVFLCDTKDIQATGPIFNENTGVVKVGKTEMFDGSQRLFLAGVLRLPRQCPEIEEYARQCCNCARFEEKDKRKGTIVFRYRPTGDGQDHFRAATNFFLLAASGHRLAKASPYRKKRQLTASLR